MLLVSAGLFAQPAMAFDHQHTNFAKFLDGTVTTAGVDYDTLKTRKAMLDGYLDEVANAPITTFDDNQKLAFYVNAYNAYTINLILTENVKSIQDIDGGKVWDQRSFAVGRKKLTLNQMEHDNVRKLGDGRIHAVVNCASKGCPPLPPKPLVPESVQGQLDEAAKRWVSTNAYRVDGKVLQLSKIFQWYGEDFTGKEAGSSSDEEKQEAAKAFITKYGGDVSAGATVEWMNYDWSLNKK